MVSHSETENHCLALSFSDLSFWCYTCDSYIESSELAGLLKHFQQVKFGSEVQLLVANLQDLTIKSREDAKEEEPPADKQVQEVPIPSPVDAEPHVSEEAKSVPEPVAVVAAEKKDPIVDLCDKIKAGEFKRISLMTGAGISVSAGIPDFRSPGTGLYTRLESLNLPTPESVFTLAYLKEHPEPFFLLAKEMFAPVFKPTPTHYFIRLLHEKGLLQMCFTQNIDGLELKAGLPREKLIQAHGHCDSSHCVKCKREFPQDQMMDHIRAGTPAYCATCGSVAKPDIVFFGENLPERFFYESNKLSSTDLLIVIGTSLVVFPFASLTGMLKRGTPKVLINRECVGNFRDEATESNVFLEGDCDDVIWRLSRELGWEDELRALMQ
jgi:NAD-dependent histone deacetylase SIR2